jgi:hypothetical protein
VKERPSSVAIGDDVKLNKSRQPPRHPAAVVCVCVCAVEQQSLHTRLQRSGMLPHASQLLRVMSCLSFTAAMRLLPYL